MSGFFERWCHPKLVVVVKHLAGIKMLRHATVKAFAQPTG